MINFNCSNCQEPLEAPESLRGEQLKCPNCDSQELVPVQHTNLERANKRRLVRRLIAAIIIAVLLTGGLIAWHVFHPPIYEMNRPQCVKFLQAKGFEMLWDRTTGAYFETDGGVYIHLDWRYISGDVDDPANYKIAEIYIARVGDQSSPDSLLAAWHRIEPDAVQFFIDLSRRSANAFPLPRVRYKDSNYIGLANPPYVYLLRYSPIRSEF